MRVALVVGQFPALSETFILSHVTGLLDRGVDVRIFSRTRLPQPTTHSAVDEYGLLERTHYGTSTPEGLWLRRAAVLRLLVEAQRSGKPVLGALGERRRDANGALPFRHLGAEVSNDFDVIHCHFGPNGLLGLALRNMGILRGRLVTTLHGYDMSRALEQEGSDLYDRLFAESDLLLPISEYWKDRLETMGCPPEKVQVQRMGVDLAQFPFLPRHVPEHGPRELLSVARLTEKKGLEYALRAVARALESEPRIRYSIAGDGELRGDLEALATKLGIQHAVRFLGGVSSTRVRDLMAKSHVLLAPSVTARDGNKEGLPVVLMESMASGLPVVSTHHSGIPELVEDGVTGLLVAERDVTALALQVCLLLDDEALYKRLAVAARERVEREHDVDRLNDRLLGIYQALVAPEGR